MFCTLLMCCALLGADPIVPDPRHRRPPAISRPMTRPDVRPGAIRTLTFGWPCGVSRTGCNPNE